MNPELIFVYNATSGVFAGIKDLISKSVSPKTYENSEPGQQRILLGSICLTGLVWQYPGLSNQ